MSDNEKYVTLNISDNTLMKAYVAYPHEKNKSCTALILFQEAGGVNNNIKSIA